ncbi:uncharacterized protein EKO05_0008913 [Ascochyta rabiei]|uniref:uncharacterized protein n=1 Tax=Didymella rabiei TaxID=5454 RepID=UPI002200702C|nr:uncharacterized protein EKO05_0008913 [Ascochyta rabiei]UPX18619.1 hypothetical protein EKO05_0008913 [Ascochyta rabiei]
MAHLNHQRCIVTVDCIPTPSYLGSYLNFSSRIRIKHISSRPTSRIARVSFLRLRAPSDHHGRKWDLGKLHATGACGSVRAMEDDTLPFPAPTSDS